MVASSASLELQQAYVELCNLTLCYLKSMALQCAVELGIPNAIHATAVLFKLEHFITPVSPYRRTMIIQRRPYLPRFMRYLAMTGIIAHDTSAIGEDVYRLTPLSHLLVDDVLVNGCTSLASFVLTHTWKPTVTAAMHLSDWFKGDDGPAALVPAEMPFKTAYGMDMWELMRGHPKLNDAFNAGMGSNTKLVLDFVMTKCGEVFDGISSLIDVGGGNGSAARAIAGAFPHVKCSVLDLPNVISDIEPGEARLSTLQVI
ncbi:hypothetical protein EJB05_48824, partial [Eragrostis curvula]